jgi:hypothetical protein
MTTPADSCGICARMKAEGVSMHNAGEDGQAVFSRLLGLLPVLTQYLLGLPQMAALVDGYEVECRIDVVPHET